MAAASTKVLVSKTLAEVTAALTAANAAPFTPARASGCGRAYVCVSGLDRATLRNVATACKALGMLYLPKAYGTTGPTIYIGYDNADGRALAKSEAFAATLKEHGIPCYADAVGD